MRQVRERWFKRPQGEPSGVCTGQRKPEKRMYRQYSVMWSRRSVHTPCFREQFPDCSGLELGEERSTVNTPEMTDVSVPIELFGNDGEARSLLEIQTCRRHEVTSGEEVRHFGADVKVHLVNNFRDISICGVNSRSVYKQRNFASSKRTVVEVHRRISSPYVKSDLSANLVQRILELLFDDHAVELTREKDLLVLRRIRVVHTA